MGNSPKWGIPPQQKKSDQVLEVGPAIFLNYLINGYFSPVISLHLFLLCFLRTEGGY
jgi:hypothetical protein